MIYECLIHLPSATFCGARTREQIASGSGWMPTDRDESQGFVIRDVQLPEEGNDPIVIAGVSVLPSQIDGRVCDGR